jgi:Na+-transporting NADH:ubiquinone oxidoreductase subunit C
MEHSNKYIFIYSTILVVVVAAVLSFTAYTLKPTQKKNVEIEKKQNILKSIGITSTPADAEALYESYIKESLVINTNGEITEGDAFNMNMKEVYNTPRQTRKLPLYKAVKSDSTFLIIPLRGKGLWGPIWGYIAFLENKNDAVAYNKVYGAIFDHQSETPGLGAEINKDWFQDPFKNKAIFDASGKFVSIEVVKGGASPENQHGVDAISGGTITSKAVQAMIDTCVSSYNAYITQKN